MTRPAVAYAWRALGVLPALCLAACASTANKTPEGEIAKPGTRTERVRYDDAGRGYGADYTLNTDRYVSSVTFNAAADSVWAALPAAYDSLGVPTEGLNSTTREVSSKVVRVRRTLAGRRLSQYLDCGTTTTGANADQYEVTLRLRSVVTPAGSGSVLHSTLAATGQMPGNSGGAIRCSSNGRLEAAIAARARQTVGS